MKEDKVLEWLKGQKESDEIEEVTDEMLNMLINQNQQLAVVFCKFFNCGGRSEFFREVFRKFYLFILRRGY